MDYRPKSIQSCKMRRARYRPAPTHEHEQRPTSKLNYILFKKIKIKKTHANLCNETVHESTDATIFPDRCRFTNEEEIQIAQILFDFAARHVTQRCNVNAITFSNRQLNYDKSSRCKRNNTNRTKIAARAIGKIK